MTAQPRRDRGSKFDFDLMDGQAGEDSLAHVICWSRFECKRDHKAEKTGNHAVEFEQKQLDGTTKPTGISVTTAQWWAIEFRQDRRWLIVHIEDLKRLARRAHRTGRHQWMGDGDRAHCALVPLAWLVEVERP